MKKLLPGALALLCVIGLAYALGVTGSYFSWPSARYVSKNIDIIESQLKYGAKSQTHFDFDESLLAHKPDKTYPEAEKQYTLLAVRYKSNVWALDAGGHIVHRWTLPYSKAFAEERKIRRAGDSAIYFEKFVAFPNGDLLATYTGWGDTPYGYGMVKMDKDSRVLWTYGGNTNHDIFIHPASHVIYTLTHDFLTWKGEDILADDITLLSADGKLIKKISILDAFEKSEFRDLLSNIQPQGFAWDMFHTNSIDLIDETNSAAFPQFKPGYILISIRNMDTIAVIDPEAEKVVWAYSGIWSAQHAAHFTQRGTIMLFDNNGGGTHEKRQSRIVEINPATLAVSVKYAGDASHPFYSCAYGRIEELTNKNLLITEPLGSRVFEISPAGNIVWQYRLKPLYQPRIPDIAPFGNKESNYTPDYLCAEQNLATAIVYAARYTPEQLPFLQEGIH